MRWLLALLLLGAVTVLGAEPAPCLWCGGSCFDSDDCFEECACVSGSSLDLSGYCAPVVD